MPLTGRHVWPNADLCPLDNWGRWFDLEMKKAGFMTNSLCLVMSAAPCSPSHPDKCWLPVLLCQLYSEQRPQTQWGCTHATACTEKWRVKNEEWAKELGRKNRKVCFCPLPLSTLVAEDFSAFALCHLNTCDLWTEGPNTGKWDLLRPLHVPKWMGFFVPTELKGKTKLPALAYCHQLLIITEALCLITTALRPWWTQTSSQTDSGRTRLCGGITWWQLRESAKKKKGACAHKMSMKTVLVSRSCS